MRNLLFLALMLISTIAFTNEPVENTEQFDTNAFCEGWDKGYVRGYCYRKQNCIEPIIPLCPIPRIGESTYEDGYNRGFERGRADG